MELITGLGKELEKKGYACVSQVYINGTTTKHFINKETFDYIQLTTEDLDDEVLWNILGTTEKEIKSKMGEKLSKDVTEKDLDSYIENQTEVYQAVIKDFIVANEEVIKD